MPNSADDGPPTTDHRHFGIRRGNRPVLLAPLTAAWIEESRRLAPNPLADRYSVKARCEIMCRSIKPLYNFEPPASDAEIHAAALQFVRKISGFTKPSKANEAAFQRAVDQIALAASELVDSLVTTAPPRNRETEAVAARERGARRFAVRAPAESASASR